MFSRYEPGRHEAVIQHEPGRDAHRLFLFERSYGRATVLMEDGSWRDIPEHERFPEGVGLVVPSWVGKTLEAYFTQAPATDGEIRRLEDALAVERARVEQVLGRLL